MPFRLSGMVVLFGALLITVSLPGCVSSQENSINGKIVFQSDRDGNYDLYIMNPDGSDQRNLTNLPVSSNTPNSNTGPAPSPDGRHVAFVSNRNGNDEIYVIDIESGVQSNLTKHEANDYSPTWSPDGKYIAFISDRDAILVNAERDIWTNNIYIMDADGSNTWRLTNDNKTDGYAGLAWSFDGKQLAFCLSSTTPYGGYFSKGIHILTLSDTSRTRLTFDQPVQQCSPKWSPDGEHILYLVTGSKLSNIYVMKSDGTNQQGLSEDPDIYDISPFWSPDGKQIVFSSRRDGSYHVYVMDADGTNLVQLTNGPGDDTFPVWLP